jgi:hypothetical protein
MDLLGRGRVHLAEGEQQGCGAAEFLRQDVFSLSASMASFFPQNHEAAKSGQVERLTCTLSLDSLASINSISGKR